MHAETPNAIRRERVFWLFLLALPFYLNDFASIFAKDWRIWLAIDYIAVKLVPLALIAWLVCSQRFSAAELGSRTQSVPAFIGTLLLLLVAGTLIDQSAYGWISRWPGYPALGAMPLVTSPVWRWLDLTAGLLLVGLLEELVFRAAMFSVLSRYTDNRAVIVLVSALAFGLIHWSQGLHTVVVTAAIGVLFMMVYLRTRSLPALVLAHFVMDFLIFADLPMRHWLHFFLFSGISLRHGNPAELQPAMSRSKQVLHGFYPPTQCVGVQPWATT